MSSPNMPSLLPTPPARKRRTSALRFLFSELRQVQELVILLRVRPQMTIVNYTQALLTLVSYPCMVFFMACSLRRIVSIRLTMERTRPHYPELARWIQRFAPKPWG